MGLNGVPGLYSISLEQGQRICCIYSVQSVHIRDIVTWIQVPNHGLFRCEHIKNDFEKLSFLSDNISIAPESSPILVLLILFSSY